MKVSCAVFKNGVLYCLSVECLSVLSVVVINSSISLLIFVVVVTCLSITGRRLLRLLDTIVDLSATVLLIFALW